MSLRLWWLLTLNALIVSADIITLEANPPKIDYLHTEEFTVNCTYEPDTTSPKHAHVLSLILSKQPLEREKDVQELASVDQQSTLHYLSKSGAAFSGRTHDTQVSYLSGTWKKLCSDLPGTYVCVVHLLDNVGHLFSLTNQTTVLKETNSVQTVASEMKRLADVLKSQQSYLTNLDAKFSESQKSSDLMALSVSYTEKTLLMSKPSQAHRGRVYYLSRYIIDGVDPAEAVCLTMGGYLAEINDTDEYEFVEKVVKGTSYSILVAGRLNVTDGRWYWPRVNQVVNFTRWLPGQPNNELGVQHCIELLTLDKSSRGINDISCSHAGRYQFICEVPVA